MQLNIFSIWLMSFFAMLMLRFRELLTLGLLQKSFCHSGRKEKKSNMGFSSRVYIYSVATYERGQLKKGQIALLFGRLKRDEALSDEFPQTE